MQIFWWIPRKNSPSCNKFRTSIIPDVFEAISNGSDRLFEVFPCSLIKGKRLFSEAEFILSVWLYLCRCVRFYSLSWYSFWSSVSNWDADGNVYTIKIEKHNKNYKVVLKYAGRKKKTIKMNIIVALLSSCIYFSMCSDRQLHSFLCYWMHYNWLHMIPFVCVFW